VASCLLWSTVSHYLLLSYLTQFTVSLGISFYLAISATSLQLLLAWRTREEWKYAAFERGGDERTSEGRRQLQGCQAQHATRRGEATQSKRAKAQACPRDDAGVG
jgi:uncharacterized paraquat-inducible protein A